jgi:MFS family permease
LPSAERRVARPLAVTLLAQVVTAMGLFSVAVLAERIAPELGVSKSLVGYYVALVFLGAGIVSYLSGGPIARYGPVRTIQIGILVSGPAILLTNMGLLWLLPVSALLLGFGYGPFTPAAAQILADATTPRWRGLVFSIKQSGAPLGTMFAGLALPFIEKFHGWRVAVAASVALLMFSALLLQSVRAGFDARRARGSSLSPVRSAQALRALLADRELRRLTVASFVFAMMQMALFSLLVVYLVSDYLVDAGDNDLILTMQLGGLVSRVLWGWIGDRFERPRVILALLGMSGGLATLGIAAIDPSWSFLEVHALCLAAGVTASGWNGLYLAELSRSTPSDRVGDTIGTAMLFTYTGLVVGSMLCTTLVIVAKSYQVAYSTMGSLSLIAGIWVLLGRGRAGRVQR